jgi:membrane-bound ClpP family serine protease
MNKIVFAPIIDFPLVIITVSAFIWHFNRWSHERSIDTTVDILSRLPTARHRVMLLFVGILLLCWTANLAVWSIFALLLGIGLVVALASSGEAIGGTFALFGAAYIIREWAFGFPQLILHPPRHEIAASFQHDGNGELTGKTGVTTVSLRPTGNALIDDVKYSVVSFDGKWIDAGVRIEVRTYRNGKPCVVPIPQAAENGESIDRP